MSESSSKDVEGRAVVIQRRGEIDECVQVLEDLGVPIEQIHGPLPSADRLAGAAVVVIPGSRLAEQGTPNLSLWPRTIAVVDDASKTMLAHISRLGVALTVRRPIHPRTLRLLLLHEIYRGPERRRKKRILIGHPIKVAAGLFTKRATLLELSVTGARIELPGTPKVGSKVKLFIGKDLTHSKPVKLQARVVRCIRPSGEGGRPESEVGVALIDAKREAKTILAILERFAAGPASWSGKLDSPGESGAAATKPTETHAPASAPTPAEPEVEVVDPEASASRLPPSVSSLPPPRSPEDAGSASSPATAPAAARETSAPKPATDGHAKAKARPAAAPRRGPVVEKGPQAKRDQQPEGQKRPAAASGPASAATDHAPEVAVEDERRQDPRIRYDRRVVALGEEAARVLVGRDLSQVGMRIAATDTVGLGDELRVALHCGTELEPLVLLATADRDRGEDGMVLSFQDLTNGQREHLEKIIASSSPIRGVEDGPDPNEQSIVLGEMLETVKKGPSLPPDAIQSDAEIEEHLDSIFDAD